MENLAIFGGEKVKKTAFGTGKRFGEVELIHLKEALDQNTLFYWSGSKVKGLEYYNKSAVAKLTKLR